MGREEKEKVKVEDIYIQRRSQRIKHVGIQESQVNYSNWLHTGNLISSYFSALPELLFFLSP